MKKINRRSFLAAAGLTAAALALTACGGSASSTASSTASSAASSEAASTSAAAELTTVEAGKLTPNEKGTGYCIAQAGGDVRALTKALNAALNGRGGGKPGICQGSCAAEPEEVKEFLRKQDR